MGEGLVIHVTFSDSEERSGTRGGWCAEPGNWYIEHAERKAQGYRSPEHSSDRVGLE
jgi:hypothetical protein